eukprot:gene8953-12074_t
MGSCCSKTGKFSAFKRAEISSPLLDEIGSRLNPETKIVIVRLASLSDLPIGNSYSQVTDAFVEMKLLPSDTVAGNQKQLSSIKPSSLSPKWEPPERFQFIVSKVNDAKVIVSVYHYNQNRPSESEPLGDAVIKLKDLFASIGQSKPNRGKYKLVNPQNGKNKGEVELDITFLSVAEAASVQEHTVYEFERWQPVIEWGHTPAPGHFYPRDPGRWCTEDGKKYGNELEDIAPPIPPGWTVTESWHTISTELDSNGWQYAINFDLPFWHPDTTSGT